MTAVWPYKPEDGAIIEALEWATDVQRTYALEYRRCVRPVPRQEWQHTYYLDPMTLQRAIQAARNLGDEEFYLPIWQELTHVGAIAATTTTLPVDATYKCYSEAGYLLIWDDEDHYETRAILTIGVGTITLESGVGADYTDALVMPVRLATFAQPFELQISSSATQWGHASARFQAAITEDLSGEDEPGIGYTRYKTFPVLLNPISVIGDSRQVHEHRVDILDSGAGGVSQLPAVEQPEQQSSVAWPAYDEAGVWGMRIWLHKHKARHKCFWIPSWTDDMVLAEDVAIDDPTITIEDIDFDLYGSFPYDLILWESGQPRLMRVVGASSGDGSTQELTLESASTVAITAANVSRMCQVRLCRFATDRIEIQHLVSNQAKLAARVVEVPAVPVAAGAGYDEHDQSEEESSPVYLFHFLQGAVNYRYTSLGATVTALGQSWDPAVIIPSEFKVSGDVPQDGLSIQLPRDNSLAATFLGYPPEVITTLTVYKGDYDDATAPIVYWVGQVTTSKADGNKVTLECDSDLQAISKRGPSVLCTRHCPYVLFGRGCNLDEDDWDESATVTNVTGATVTLSTPPTGHYAGGALKTPDGVRLTIYAHASGSATLTLLYKSKSMHDQMVANPGGFAVTLYSGCNRSLTECEITYGNKGNFGGSFGIPVENPTNRL